MGAKYSARTLPTGVAGVLRLRLSVLSAVAVAVVSAIGVSLHADLPVSRLLTVFPPGSPAGSTNEITVSGTDLEDPSGLVFSDPRLQAAIHPSKPSVFLVSIPAEVPPGPVDVRWMGRFGLSGPRAFLVGSGPELLLNATNTTPESAVTVAPGTVVNGRMPAGQALWFRVGLNPGQQVRAEVEARAVDSRLEPVLRLFDGRGSQIDESRRGWIEIASPRAGESLIQIRDVTYRGGDEFPFRFVVTEEPRLDFALPNVLKPGVTNTVTVYGRNLEGGKPSPLVGVDGWRLEQRAVEISVPEPGAGSSTNAAVDGIRRAATAFQAGTLFSWRMSGSNGVSNPLLFGLSTLPVVVTPTEGGKPPPLPVVVRPPAEFNGLFPRRGELSGVSFEAKKGEVFWLELWAERLGFAADPFAVVQRLKKETGANGEPAYADVQELNDNEANPGGSEFNSFTRDPVARFEAPEDGTYRILVRDLFHSVGSGPRMPYRLSVRRESPGFSLVALPVQPVRANDNDRAVHPLAPLVRRGGVELIRVLVQRRDGFGGDIDLSVSGLPPGMTSGPTRIAAGQNVGFVPLIAGPGAGGAFRPVIRGRGVSGTNVLEVAAVMAVTGPAADFNETGVPGRLVVEGMASASDVEWAPVSVEVSDGAVVDAAADGKVPVPVTVARRGEFPGAFNLKLTGRPELDKSKEASVPEKATNAVLELNVAESKLPEGVHRVWLQGQVAGKYRNQPEALTRAEEDVKALDAALAAASAADKPALEERRKAAEEKRKAAEERAKPRDVTFRVYSRPFDLRILPPPKPEPKPEAAK